MERFDDDSDIRAPEPRGRQPTQKRAWREIEALKDKYRLQRELQSIDIGFQSSLDDIPL